MKASLYFVTMLFVACVDITSCSIDPENPPKHGCWLVNLNEFKRLPSLMTPQARVWLSARNADSNRDSLWLIRFDIGVGTMAYCWLCLYFCWGLFQDPCILVSI